MPRSLQNTIPQPQHTKAVIQAALRSPRGVNKVWCIVEAEDDQRVYEKFFDPNVLCVLSSEDEDGRKSCHNVEKIVQDLHIEENNPKVFGIRDKDYTHFDISYIKPANVFLTDNRDLEMMMYSAPSVVAGLEIWHHDFPMRIGESMDKCRYLGGLRIYNEVKQCNCKFQGNINKVSLIWDYNTQSIRPDYRANLLSKFQQNIQHTVTEKDIEKFFISYRLDTISSYDLCQGHDVGGLLRAMMKSAPYNRQKELFNKMTEAYSLSDFQHTQLYKDINIWLQQR